MRWLSRVFGGDVRAPRNADDAIRKALLAVLDRRTDEAERLLGEAARLEPDAVESYLALARLLRGRGEIGRAIRIHQNLLLQLPAGSPQARAVLEDLAADFRQGGFLRRAIASYEELLAAEPRHPGALRALVKLRADARDFERGLALAKRLARVDREDGGRAEADLRVQMAEAALGEGRTDDARRAVKVALRRDKAHVDGWILLGEIEAERNKPKAALAAWKRVPELSPEAAGRVYGRLEATWAALDDARDFEPYVRRILEDRPDDSAARIALAEHLAARGDCDPALEEYRRVLERDPDDLRARAAAGRLLLSEHRDAEAAKAFAELLDVIERRAGDTSGESLG